MLNVESTSALNGNDRCVPNMIDRSFRLNLAIRLLTPLFRAEIGRVAIGVSLVAGNCVFKSILSGNSA